MTNPRAHSPSSIVKVGRARIVSNDERRNAAVPAPAWVIASRWPGATAADNIK